MATAGPAYIASIPTRTTAAQKAQRHSAVVRLTHWINVLSFVGLVVSGFAIILAHPRFYWGETGGTGTPSVLDLPLPFMPGGPSGWGRNLHFLSAWVCVVNGALYLLSGTLERHFRNNLLPARADMSWSSIGRVISNHRDPFYSGRPEAAAAVRANNEYHAKLVQQYPKRFGFFANVPINDIDGSLKEIEYAMDTLKADGMAMWTSTPDKKYPGNDMYKPIMEELNRRKVAVFIHPAHPWCCRNIDPPVPDIMGEYDFDVTRAGESLLMHGTFESSPDIKFIFVHSGGAIPMLAGRIRDRVKQGKREDLEPKVFDLLRKQYYDIAHASFPFPFGALRNFVPNSQILFGTDFPAQAIASTTDPIPTLGLSAANLQAIYNGNALRLFPRLKALS